uniref:C2 domain-containing protein n=1 Tax=Caenorhabditis tropicalis TaxID=1561998 RepID=A0A1I7TEW0_9PELO
MNLSTDLKHLEKQEWEAEWGQADKPIHSALLMVYIDSVADLPYPKSKLEPSPFVEVGLGKQIQRTPVKVKTVNPLFQSKFLFFVRHLEGQELKFEAIDDGTRRSLGNLSIPLTTLLKEPNLEQNQQMHMLTLGVHQSPIVITTRIRVNISEQHGVIRGCVDRLLLFGLDDDVRNVLSDYENRRICRTTDRKLLRLFPLSAQTDVVQFCSCNGDFCNDHDMLRELSSSHSLQFHVVLFLISTWILVLF